MDAALRKVVDFVTPATEIAGGWGYGVRLKNPGGCAGVALWSRRQGAQSACGQAAAGISG
jgi:hypothetical protein